MWARKRTNSNPQYYAPSFDNEHVPAKKPPLALVLLILVITLSFFFNYKSVDHASAKH